MGRRGRSKGAQILMILNTHGGARPGAGRPNIEDEGAHCTRPDLDGKAPLHVVLRLKDGFPPLKNKKLFHFFARAVKGARLKGLRVVEFSLKSRELHLIVEAPRTVKLSRGMQSLGTSMAKSLRNLVGPARIPDYKKKFLKVHERKKLSAVFEKRFELTMLETKAQVKKALNYVLKNSGRSVVAAQTWADTGLAWVSEILAAPQSWLLKVGWREA